MLPAGAEEIPASAEKASGVLIANAKDMPPASGRFYAQIDENGARFDLDAAFVYYVEADAESAYAGEACFTKLRFWANVDTNQIGAEGTVTLRRGRKGEVTCHYLYADDRGIYFYPEAPFARHVAGETLTGVDFPCEVRIDEAEPVRRVLLVFWDASDEVLLELEYDGADVTDGQEVDTPERTVVAELIGYAADGTEVMHEWVAAEDVNPYFCTEGKGLLLERKAIGILWEY